MDSQVTLIRLFQKSVATHADKVALIYDGEKISYRDLDGRVRKIAGSLMAMGIRKGDRVGILLKNSPDYIFSFYGALLAGATVVPVNHMLKAGEMEYILNDCEVKVLVSSGDFRDIHQVLRGKLPGLVGIYFIEHEFSEVGRSVKFDFPVIYAEDLAVVIYTSGTTGKPKGAMLSHRAIGVNVKSCEEILKVEKGDCFALLLPMFHSFMMTVCIVLPLSVGASILLVKSLSPAKSIFKEIIRQRATILPAIPQLFQAMTQAKLPFYFNWIFPVRAAISGAAPLPVETLAQFARKFRFPLLEGYGLSEAGPVVSFNPVEKGRQKAGTVGLPIPNVNVSIRDDSGQDLSSGEVGEICVQGQNVMTGYWNQPEETAATLKNGWLHTGDLGFIDQEGYITIVDRKKDMLLVRGMNVYPREIEEVLYQYPGVKEAAVVAKIDEKKGEIPIAFISMQEGVSADLSAIDRFLREKLADFKQPREIRLVKNLPRTASGKILKQELRKEI